MAKNNNQLEEFVALFNELWYPHFTALPGHEGFMVPVAWSTHIASTVKQCSDLMGLPTCFKADEYTDAVIQTTSLKTWARIKWEWGSPATEKVGEFFKIANAEIESEYFFYIGYSAYDDPSQLYNLKRYAGIWKNTSTPLIMFLVRYSYLGGQRCFEYIETYELKGGIGKLLHRQPAQPWQKAIVGDEDCVHYRPLVGDNTGLTSIGADVKKRCRPVVTYFEGIESDYDYPVFD